MKTTKESGFSDILIAIFALLIIAGFVLWFVVGSRPKQQQATSSVTAGQGAQQSQTTNDPNKGYMVIGEWGVRFKPTAGLSGIIYRQVTADSIVLTTSELAALSATCGTSAEGYTALGVLRRSQLPLSEYETYLGKLGQYYYYYNGPQSACTQDPKDSSVELTSKQRIQESLVTLEEIP